jgi:hypothetical protein
MSTEEIAALIVLALLVLVLPYFCTNREHFNFFIQTERVLTLKNVTKSGI